MLTNHLCLVVLASRWQRLRVYRQKHSILEVMVGAVRVRDLNQKQGLNETLRFIYFYMAVLDLL